MKQIKKITAFVFFSCLAALSLQADVLFQDSLNYPYADGSIEGQGQWYCYYPSTPNQNAFVTNNVLYMVANSANDSVATPTNGWVNSSGTITWASFTINVSQLPASTNGGYFCQLQDNNDTNDVCHIFINTRNTNVPGTYQLAIANFDTSFSTIIPPVNFPLDLATGVTYTVVFAYDTDINSPLTGGTLMINPSYQDYQNLLYDTLNGTLNYFGQSYVYPTDTTGSSGLLNIQISQIGFSPYIDAGFSNVMAGTNFTDVNTTNLPAFGIQPEAQQTNYSGNNATFYAVASGSDITYQWYNTGGMLSDGSKFSGSTSNTLVIIDLAGSDADTYYCKATDAYGNVAISSNGVETVITTPTAPFFPPAEPGQPSIGGLFLTNNLFTYFSLTDIANGTGPLTYQWYFAPTNTPDTFSELSGQTNSTLVISELEYSDAGNYYVQATGSYGSTPGPTNNLVVTPPNVATLSQLHTFMSLVVTNISGTNVVSISPNVTVSGYVTTFGPLTASTKTYSEFYLGYEGYGIYVFYGSAGTNGVPPAGSYVTVSGSCQVYHGQLEIDASSGGVSVSNNVPQMPAPNLGDFNDFQQMATNALGDYGVKVQCSLMTFTNIYIYGTRTGGAYTGNSGMYFSNGYTALYMTLGPYSNPDNTNSVEIYVPAYGFGSISTNFWGQVVPNQAYQISGVMANYKGTSELDVTRIEDIVTNPPPSFTASLTQTNGVPTITWSAQTGSTYSVMSAGSLTGPWTNQAFGLSYYPVVGTFTDTNRATMKFYRISSP